MGLVPLGGGGNVLSYSAARLCDSTVSDLAFALCSEADEFLRDSSIPGLLVATTIYD